MPTFPLIDTYDNELEDLKTFGGSDNELNIRPAFQNCLSKYCANHREKLILIPELAGPDGTVKDSLRMARGLGEVTATASNSGKSCNAGEHVMPFPVTDCCLDASPLDARRRRDLSVERVSSTIWDTPLKNMNKHGNIQR